jgi:hypothetical protein
MKAHTLQKQVAFWGRPSMGLIFLVHRHDFHFDFRALRKPCHEMSVKKQIKKGE